MPGKNSESDSDSEKPQHPDLITITIVGPQESGKSSLITSYGDNKVIPKYTPTVFTTSLLTYVIDKKMYKIQVSELGGDPAYKALEPLLYKNPPDGFIFVFDYTEKNSLTQTMDTYFDPIQELFPFAQKIFIGNKTDKCNIDRSNTAVPTIPKSAVNRDEARDRCKIKMPKKADDSSSDEEDKKKRDEEKKKQEKQKKDDERKKSELLKKEEDKVCFLKIFFFDQYRKKGKGRERLLRTRLKRMGRGWTLLRRRGVRLKSRRRKRKRRLGRGRGGRRRSARRRKKGLRGRSGMRR
jgi:GTPase SAR1 family protein